MLVVYQMRSKYLLLHRHKSSACALLAPRPTSESDDSYLTKIHRTLLLHFFSVAPTLTRFLSLDMRLAGEKSSAFLRKIKTTRPRAPTTSKAWIFDERARWNRVSSACVSINRAETLAMALCVGATYVVRQRAKIGITNSESDSSLESALSRPRK